MPTGELSHRFRIATLRAFLSSLLILWSGLAGAQSISNVSVSKKPGAQQQTTDFTLKISGKNFGDDKSKISVVVTPKAPILQPPAVADASQGGSTLIVTFTAPDDYDPETVIV